MLSFLKTQNYTDNTLSMMRGIYVMAGFFGTWLVPWLEGRVGSVHCGSISLWYGIYPLNFPVNHSRIHVVCIEGRLSVASCLPS